MNMNTIYYTKMDSHDITIAESNGAIIEIAFGSKDIPEGENKKTRLLVYACRQLEEYFAGERREFDLPLSTKGTLFQKKVWEALCTIPYGETRSYRDIALQTGNEKACRAVGMANHNNPIAIVIPCHRVVGANGKLTGYAGGLDKKQFLLELERKYAGNQKRNIIFGR